MYIINNEITTYYMMNFGDSRPRIGMNRDMIKPSKSPAEKFIKCLGHMVENSTVKQFGIDAVQLAHSVEMPNGTMIAAHSGMHTTSYAAMDARVSPYIYININNTKFKMKMDDISLRKFALILNSDDAQIERCKMFVHEYIHYVRDHSLIMSDTGYLDIDKVEHLNGHFINAVFTTKGCTYKLLYNEAQNTVSFHIDGYNTVFEVAEFNDGLQSIGTLLAIPHWKDEHVSKSEDNNGTGDTDGDCMKECYDRFINRSKMCNDTMVDHFDHMTDNRKINAISDEEERVIRNGMPKLIFGDCIHGNVSAPKDPTVPKPVKANKKINHEEEKNNE